MGWREKERVGLNKCRGGQWRTFYLSHNKALGLYRYVYINPPSDFIYFGAVPFELRFFSLLGTIPLEL
jgi:hypothetical protein